MIGFTYDEFITRNIGFVSVQEQEILKHANIFIPGVGGMGGAALACLARVGVCNFTIADIDTFEVSNLNRQIFSSLDVSDVTKRT
jgi:tRNA A37 threonylcarbamoyladenosine dehydratase